MSGAASSTSDVQTLCIDGLDTERAERLLAEAVEAGALGAEEREEAGGISLILYAPRARVDAVAAACRALGAEVGAATDLAAVDWSEAWKAELHAVEISPRLRVRPPFDDTPLRVGQRELVIEPGQAFGTGGHESTRLALAWLDALGPELAGARVLDAGVGSGVLGLAALAGGARLAVGFDLDPLAAPAARANAARNALTEGLALFTGPVGGLAPSARFEGVVANLLRRELEPLLPALASRLQAGGWFVISGLLAEELPRVETGAARCGLHREGLRGERDASGVEWVAALLRAAPR